MILTRLYDLAVRENLLANPAFESQPVPYVIELGSDGIFLGVSVTREEEFIPSKKKGGEPKKKLGKGRILAVPRAHGNTASQGFARYFCDTVSRIVSMSNDLDGLDATARSAELSKRERSRTTFWQQIDRAADETDDPAMRSVQLFGRRLASDADLASEVEDQLSSRRAAATDRCTFAYQADNGPTILDRSAIRAWYVEFHRQCSGAKQEAGPTGFCQVTSRTGPIPKTHPMKLQVPGWMSVGVSLVSYDKAAFESYGLEGTANASVGYEAAEGYAVALTALIQSKLPRGIRSASRVGDSLFLYWTREPASLDFLEQFDHPDPKAVEGLIASLVEGRGDAADPNPNDFYCLTLSSNSARVIVRDYLEEPLPRARANAAAWFADLRIASTNINDCGHPIATFPHWQLAATMTAPKSGNQPDWSRINDLVPQLWNAALRGGPLPDSILSTCLSRLRAEGGKGFRPARMALMKLCLIRKGVTVSETLNSHETNAASICGELLAVFDQIQRAALGKLNANVIDKYYGGMSAAPSTALGILFGNAQNHLRKLRGEKPAYATFLENRLTEATSKLKEIPEGQLSLTNQARFALGYYHAKARQLEEAASRRREKEEKIQADKARKAAAAAKD